MLPSLVHLESLAEEQGELRLRQVPLPRGSLPFLGHLPQLQPDQLQRRLLVREMAAATPTILIATLPTQTLSRRTNKVIRTCQRIKWLGTLGSLNGRRDDTRKPLPQ
jgi:predicted ABC-type transport system involved in lysophospholipase L1 biosynthesis ATPase subunit